MATKSDKQQVRGLIEGLEFRAHRGPPIRQAEIQSVHELLRQRGFSPTSGYFSRLSQLTNRLQSRTKPGSLPCTKRNYGGSAGGRQMQVQSVFDHVLLSTCYEGSFNGRQGRVKISHRFNRAGRIDFVELKYLRSLHGPLNGELRKLLMIEAYQSIRKDWLEAEAAALRVLPRELIFLYENVFQCPREDVLAWLVNIGHGIVGDLLTDLKAGRVNGSALSSCREPDGAGLGSVDYGAKSDPSLLGWFADKRAANGASAGSAHGGAGTVCLEEECQDQATAANRPQTPQGGPVETVKRAGQLPLTALAHDEVALPILEQAAGLESVVQCTGPEEAMVRYVRKGL